MHSVSAAEEVSTTPNKRKRNTTNTAANKENNFTYNGFMETKSIGELLTPADNPFEVIRKPPKKKKKRDSERVCCFDNEALNLNGPEKSLNPFEIRRASTIGIPIVNGFVNSGLNIRGPEKDVCNPFEIVRDESKNVQSISTPPTGIENPALELQPTPRAIGIPFTPTIGCRIDFNDVPLASLTPCSMLAKTLVFTPDKQAATPKRLQPTTLSMISEESVDIEDQLNCYQLELENSINEAKSNEKRGKYKNLMDVKHKVNFADRLRNAQYSELGTAEVAAEPKVRPTFAQRIRHSQYSELDGGDDKSMAMTATTDDNVALKPKVVDMIAKCTASSDVVYEELSSREDLCEDYDSASENESEFKNPAPFVRTYRRTAVGSGFKKPANPDAADSKESHRKTSGIRNSIRKSIRKLMSNNHAQADRSENAQTTNVFSTLRQSFRKKVGTKQSESLLYDSSHDVSILIESDRKVFKQLSPNQKRVNVISDGAVSVTKKSVIRGSFRSTKRHVLKSVFKKNVEDYCLD